MRKRQLFYVTVLSVMLSVTLIGSVLLSQVAARERTATVTFYPDRYNWRDPPPDPWQAKVSVGWFYTLFIDPDSILLEGTVAPEYCTRRWFRFYAYFDGNDVKEVIGSKLAHDGGVLPGTYYVELTITGKLITSTWEGSDIITVTVPQSKPP